MNSKDKNNGNNRNNLFNNKYEQVRLLGEGSFGKAFLVESIEDKSLAVIKAIDLGNMSEDEKQEARQEGKILEKLDHPNIIKFKEVYIDEKNSKQILHIVMDYADGGDLQQRIRAQKGKYFSETLIVDWFTQICLAIKHIHDRKILHRDIKSQNIFLTKNGLVKLGDFGIAKCLNKTMDKAKTIVGTPYYLSPEIIQNRPYNFKSDIWSLGVLLYEMCALKMPFDAQNLPLLSLKIIRCSYNPLPPNFSKGLRSLINIMLSVDPSKRLSINEILKQPIISSRIKNFLGEMDYNREFSHTILHNFKLMKSPKGEVFDLIGGKDIKDLKESKEGGKEYSSGGNGKFDSNLSEKNNVGKESNNNYNNNKDSNNYQKPIIKKDNVSNKNVNNNINNANNANNKNKKNYHFLDKEVPVLNNKEREKEIPILNSKEREKEFPIPNSREREKDENINLLKRNLLGNGIPNNYMGNNRENKPHGIIINPSFAFNYDKDKDNNINKKVKQSIEIESNRTPKIESANKIIPESKPEKRVSDRKSEIPTNNVYENLKRNNYKKKDMLILNNGNINNINNLNREKEIPSSLKNSENVSVSTNIEKDPVSVNVSVNISERKRSESKGSQKDEGKEKVSLLKDFMKNMKEKIKNNPQQGDGNIIWMKGMKDMIDKEKESYNMVKMKKDSKERDQDQKININSNINIIPTKNDNYNIIHNKNENFHYKNKNSKDLREYIETQKMLMELEKLQNEELEEVNHEENFEDNINYDNDILNEFKDLNEDLIAAEDEYLNNKYYDNIEGEYLSNNKNKEILAIREPSNGVSTDIESNSNNYLNLENTETSLKSDLENELGRDLFQKVYKILSENLNSSLIFFDLEKINTKIKQECQSFGESVDVSILRVPDIYCLIIKDRERENVKDKRIK